MANVTELDMNMDTYTDTYTDTDMITDILATEIDIDDCYDPLEPHPNKYVLMTVFQTVTPLNGDTHFMPLYRLKYLSSYEASNTSDEIPLAIGECVFIMSNGTPCELDIADALQHQDVCMVAILKTFWLKILQRKWKRVMTERKRIWERRTRPSSIHHRTLYGKWPLDCREMPDLRGLLCELSHKTGR